MKLGSEVGGGGGSMKLAEGNTWALIGAAVGSSVILHLQGFVRTPNVRESLSNMACLFLSEGLMTCPMCSDLL